MVDYLFVFLASKYKNIAFKINVSNNKYIKKQSIHILILNLICAWLDEPVIKTCQAFV